MGRIGDALKDLVVHMVAFVVMIILAIIGFFFTIFVVDFGAQLAGFDPGADFAVLSATILVAASILAGGGSPIGFLSGPIEPNQ